MVPEHAAYRIMDVDMPWAEDVEDAGEGGARNVKNKFFNRAFAWMFHRAVCDSSCSLGWLLPKAALEANAAVDELCSRLIPDEDGEESRLVGPVLLATFAWAVMCTPWYSFKGLQEKPSHEVWFNQQLDFYSKWGSHPMKFGSISNSTSTQSGVLRLPTRGLPRASSSSTRHSSSLESSPIAANLVALSTNLRLAERKLERTFRPYPRRVIKASYESRRARPAS